jgi:hypothetical protein
MGRINVLLPQIYPRSKWLSIFPSCDVQRMAESAALLVKEVCPEQLVRKRVLSLPYSLRFLFVSHSAIMVHMLFIIYHCNVTHLKKKTGFSRKTAQKDTLTLAQRFGSALNLNIHFPMLFLDGVVYAE